MHCAVASRPAPCARAMREAPNAVRQALAQCASRDRDAPRPGVRQEGAPWKGILSTMHSLGLRSILRRRADVRFRVIDGEAVVVRQSAAEVVVLNEVAARILALADGSTSLEGWIDVLVAEYDTARETLEQ